MRIRLLTSLAGAYFANNIGDVIDQDDGTAGRMIAAGLAEAVAEDTPAASKKATATKKPNAT